MAKLSCETKQKLGDKEWLYHQYITLKKNTVQLAEELGCSYSTINNCLKKHDIYVRGSVESHGISKNVLDSLTKDYLIDMYVNKRNTLKEISNIVGCSRDVVANTMKRFGIERRGGSYAQGISKDILDKLNDKDWLYDQYVTNNKNAYQLGEELGCSRRTIINYLKNHDIYIRQGAESRGISKESFNKLNDKDWLYDQYIVQRKNTYQLAEELVCSHNTINRYLKKNGISIRTISEAQGISKELLDKLNDKQWLYNQYVTLKKGALHLSEELVCSPSTISRHLKKHDIIIRTISEAQGISKESLDKLNNKEWLYDQYVINNKNTYQLGEELGCSNLAVSRYLNKNDIITRKGSDAQGISKESSDKLNNKEWLYDQYVTLKKNPIQIGEELGCSHVTINNYLNKHDINIRSSSEAHGLSKELLETLDNKELLEYEYVTLKKSTYQLGEELGCSYSTINKCLKKHDIPINNSYSRSYGENQVFEFVKQYCSDTIQSYKIGRKEIDIFIPFKNVGIEFNGIYWHTEDKVGKDYHLSKTALCEENGIQLLHIFEDEWIDPNKQEIWKSIILNKLGLTSIKIPARKCRIVELISSKATEFHNEHHLHGACISKEHIGLVYNDEIMMVLSHGKSRYKKDELEIHRITTKKNVVVQGGLSRLIKQLPSGIYMTYCDKRYGTGKSYNEQFKLIGKSSPNYWWVKDGNKYTRVKCQKHKLNKLLGDQFREEWTETENMTNAGYNKLYDCGNYKFEFIH